MSYDGLIEAMIDAQAEILGDQAVTVARGVRGLEVDDDGSVLDIRDDPVTVVDDLVAAYVDNLGEAAASRLVTVAADYEEDLELPTSLRE